MSNYNNLRSTTSISGVNYRTSKDKHPLSCTFTIAKADVSLCHANLEEAVAYVPNFRCNGTRAEMTGSQGPMQYVPVISVKLHILSTHRM